MPAPWVQALKRPIFSPRTIGADRTITIMIQICPADAEQAFRAGNSFNQPACARAKGVGASVRRLGGRAKAALGEKRCLACHIIAWRWWV